MREVRAPATIRGVGLVALAVVACGGSTIGAREDGQPGGGVNGGAGGAGAGGAVATGGSGVGGEASGLVVAADGSRWDCITHYEINPVGPRATDCRCLPLGPADPAPGCPADAPEGTCVSGPCTYREGCCVVGHPTLPDGCRCFEPGNLGLSGCESLPAEQRVSTCPGDVAFTDVNLCEARPPREPEGFLHGGSPCCPRADVAWGICRRPIEVPEAVRGMIGIEGCNAFAAEWCAPDMDVLAAHPSTALVPCSTDLGDGRALEGRCLPDCLVTSVTAMGHLEQSGCAAGLVCATCYDAVDGEPTGACSLAPGDAPVSAPPSPLAACGGSPVPIQAYCAPEKWTLGGLSSLLPRLTCPAGDVCAPREKVLDPHACSASCMAGGVVAGKEARYRWGACMPTFVARALHADLDAFDRGSCALDDLCVPCLNPFSASGEEKTGVCD